MTKTTIYRNIFLVLFIISCSLIPLAIEKESTGLVVFLRCARIVLLVLFYITSTQKQSTLFIVSLIPFLVSGIFFVFNSSSIYGMLALIVSRILLIKLVIPQNKKVDWKLFTRITGLFLAVASGILSLFYKNTFLFYISATTGLVLIVLLSLTFMNLLLQSRKSGTLEMFLAVFIFMISDIVFGIEKINETNKVNMMFSAVFYNVAYFLICWSLIMKDKDTSNKKSDTLVSDL